MTIDRFTQADFEKVLDGLDVPYNSHGLEGGEFVYDVPVTYFGVETNKRIIIRSSVRYDGQAAMNGRDSIRHFVQYFYKGNWHPFTRAQKRWTTRVPGWQERLIEALRELWGIALKDTLAHNPGLKKKAKSAKAIAKSESGSPNAPDESKLQEGDADAANIASGVFGIEASESDAARDVPQDSLRETYSLDAEQAASVNAKIGKPTRVSAGPGSGKTTVLTHRIAHLIETGVHSETIVAVTLTKKMAGELLSRTLELCPAMGDASNNVCTIHALCNRILKAEGGRHRVPSFFEIKLALEKIIAAIWNADDRPGWKEVYFWINVAKSHCLNCQHDMEIFSKVFDKDGNNVGRELHEARLKFDAWLNANSKLTFNDMFYRVEKRLQEDSQFRARWQSAYRHVLVDEAQDTTHQAMRILTTIAKNPDGSNGLYIVGDVDQLLYRFAGATPEVNMTCGFDERYPDGLSFNLVSNYRSKQEIVWVASGLIAHNYDGKGGPYSNKYLKQLRPTRESGAAINFAEYPGQVTEASSVAGDIARAIKGGARPDGIFVLSRTRAQLGYLESPLTRLGVPYINTCGGCFYMLKHIADVIAYLALAVDNENSKAFERVYRIGSNANTFGWDTRDGLHKAGEYNPSRFVGKDFLAKCTDFSTGKPSMKWIWKAAKTKQTYRDAAIDIDEFVHEIEGTLSNGPAVAIKLIIENCYEKYLRASEGITSTEDNGKIDDLLALVEMAREFATVGDFLNEVKRTIKQAKLAKKGDWAEHVVLATVHGVKGMERDIVYIIGASEGVDKESGKPFGLLPHTYSLIAPPVKGKIATGQKGLIEDERCIMFVAATRARESVFVSSPMTINNKAAYPCRFVEEMQEALRGIGDSGFAIAE